MVKEIPLSTPVSQSLKEHVPLAQVWQELVASMAKTPWLVRPLMRQGADAVARVAQQYLRPRRLPRRVRRALERRGALSLAGAALLLALAGPEPGWAGTTLSVSSGGDLFNAILLFNAQKGTYAGTNTATLTADITVTSALDAVTSAIVISGNGHQIAGSGSLSGSLFQVTSKGTLTLQDTTVTGGKGSKGGAIYNQGTLTLSESTLTDNTASSKGGALFNNKGTVVLSNSTVSDSSAGTAGGGVYNEGGRLTLTDSTVSGNSAGTSGGGLYNSGGRLTLTNSTVSDNRAKEYGGGVENTDSGTVVLSNSTVSNNSASENGGGIRTSGDTVTVSNSTVSGNHAKNGGGIFISRNSYQQKSEVAVQNSTISGNVATDGGGGIGVHHGTAFCRLDSNDNCHYSYYRFVGPLKVTYSTLSDNSANFGGGLNVGRYTSVSLENSTLSGNSASDSGGGLNAYPDGTDVFGRSHITFKFCTLTGNTAADKGGGISTGEHTDLTLYDTLVSGNHAPTGREVRNNTSYSDISFDHNNLFGYSGSSGLNGKAHGNSDIIPSVGLSAILDTTLADNDGDTQTHALVSGSPAINAASTSCPSPSLDQREYGRPASGSSVCDIGAFEYGATDTSVSGTLSSGTVLKVDTTQASVTLSFKIPVVPPLDLSQAGVHLHKGLVHRGVELVADVRDLRLVLREDEAKADRVIFDTVSERGGKGKVELRRRGGVLEGKVRLEKVEVAAPLVCTGEPVELESEVVLSDDAGRYPALRLMFQTTWECQQRSDGRVEKLTVHEWGGTN
jgi:predicted outer membrane repeat protein